MTDVPTPDNDVPSEADPGAEAPSAVAESAAAVAVDTEPAEDTESGAVDEPAGDDAEGAPAAAVGTGLSNEWTGGEGAVLDEDALLEQEEPPPAPVSPYDRPGKWFVLHTQSGYENKVRKNIEARTQSMNMGEPIHEVVIPMEDDFEVKNGKKVVVQTKVFPG